MSSELFDSKFIAAEVERQEKIKYGDLIVFGRKLFSGKVVPVTMRIVRTNANDYLIDLDDGIVYFNGTIPASLTLGSLWDFVKANASQPTEWVSIRHIPRKQYKLTVEPLAIMAED